MSSTPSSARISRHRRHLPRAAVDQQKVGPGVGLALRVFLQQPFEAAGQHLFHHAEVVAVRPGLGLDVELAVLRFQEAIRPRPRSCRPRHWCPGCGSCRRPRSAAAGASRSKASASPASSLFCVALSAIRRARLSRALRAAFSTSSAFSPRCGTASSTLRPARSDRSCGHQIGVFDRVRQQDQPRRLLVVVELGEEGLHDLGLFRARAGARVEIAVAPALVGADEEHLHAGLPAFQMQRDHIGLGHARAG